MTEEPHRTSLRSVTPVWKWLIIGVLTILVVALVAAFPRLRPPVEPPPPGISEFKSVGDGFTIRYPETWVKLDPEELDKLNNVYTFAALSEEPPAILGVRALSLSAATGTPNNSKIKLSVLSAWVDKTLSERFEKFKKVSSSTVRLSSDEEALEFEFRFIGKDKVPMRGHSLIVPVDSRVFFVMGSTTEENYDEVNPDFVRILETFRITY